MTGGNNYGNRLDNRQRGNASQLLDKYRALARDAQQAGDRVTTEYYLQYAEHYYRVLGDYRDKQGEPVRRQRDYDDEDSSGYSSTEAEADNNDDGDSGDDYGQRRQRPEGRDQTRDRNRDDRPREDRPREDRPRDDRPRDDRPRDDRDRDDRPRSRDDRNRDDRNRDDRNRDDRNRDDRDRPRAQYRDDRDQPRDAAPRRARDWNRDERDAPERAPASLPASPRARDLDEDESPIPGLPGPARPTVRRRRPLADVDDAPEAAAAMTPAPMTPANEPDELASTSEEMDAPAPRRRGRPRKVEA